MAKPISSQDPFSMTDDQIMKEVYESHIPGDENYDVEALLNVAKNIIKHSTQIADAYLMKNTTKSIEFAKDKPLPKGLTLPLSKLKQIGYQMTYQSTHEKDHAHQTTMAILYKLRNSNWDVKAAITLAAFAMEYGNFWHRAEIQATILPLGKSLALLNGGFDINRLQNIDIEIPAFDEFHNLVKLVLQIIEYIVELKKLSEIGVGQREVPELLEAIQEIHLDVYWFGQKKNNFCYGKDIDSADLAPARPTDIVYPLGKSSFPEDFIFGTATSAYQIEGAINKRGKSAWDTFTHLHPEKITDRSNGDVACDSYCLYDEDIKLMKEMNTRAYRFSISWSRILPELIPFVTLFHVDRPQVLEDKYGGFLKEDMIYDFRDFADLCFEKFGSWVKHWITFNEPHIYCYTGYVDGSFAPGHSSDPGIEPYKVAHNILRAHSEAVQVYKNKYKASQNGEIGITLDSMWAVPYSNEKKDRKAAFRAMDFWLGWFMEPLTTGAYPETMRTRVGERLRPFSDDESKKLKGSFDFIGINYYTSKFAADYSSENDPPSYITDTGVHLTELISFVTLFHMDYPQALQHEYGGFLSEEIAYDFRDFARLCFKEFGHLVKHWITFNEPHTYFYAGYIDGSSAAGRISDPGREPYRVGHNILLVHAEAVEVYNTGFKVLYI
ncbi:hypothetical protein L6164_025773 [Bauhinia variegata]|uniref:Uncharacterized protein n=1 Tax=Bauhinia variegata TaxID=167791 RepID=A0ACB9M1G7_BAUVA|nr:hypothetical protein L6164_025773 [Bauhinia variegata]